MTSFQSSVLRTTLARTCTQMRNFLIRDGVNLAKWVAKFCGVATLASRMYTSPATPMFSSFNLMSPIIRTTFMPSATLAAIWSRSTPRIMTTRRPLGVKPGSGGTLLEHDENHYYNNPSKPILVDIGIDRPDSMTIATISILNKTMELILFVVSFVFLAYPIRFSVLN